MALVVDRPMETLAQVRRHECVELTFEVQRANCFRHGAKRTDHADARRQSIGSGADVDFRAGLRAVARPGDVDAVEADSRRSVGHTT